MLAIKPSSQKPEKCSANVLPCQIKYDGPIEAKQRYWKPVETHDGSKSAYFRGRELRGTDVALPEGFRGSVLQITEKRLHPPPADSAPDSDEEEIPEDIKIAEELAAFDSVTVWGHDSAPSETEDAYFKGLKEWIAFSTAVRDFGLCRDRN
ncbi:ribonuclease H1 small subunit [Pseudovirgaria hyperparasitica]|uniref:Ribonuclease H1 small subunit n=1 Tax=Pseudovirgaria hyperparasitica TaxID=470096 RepID=A0A6A6VTC6_9PEZI|nr:ribonuclease H1 small subunit [Pseudovirgaria hyperparasitica]KAF2753046.1 ribonuclease H1 small subunit [Pseudovirgaria hyperparasitica]